MMLMALIAASCLAHGDTVKSLAMVFLGLLVGIIGTDVNSGMARYSFGIAELTDGIGFSVIAVGLFAISEIVKNLESGGEEVHEVFTDIKHVYPTVDDLRMSTGPILRGTAVGSFFGTLPGTGPSISAFASYMIEKKVAKDPSWFGVLGYVLMKLECEPAPIILAYVLGPLMEENLRRALLISRGDPSVFFTRPISLAFMIVAVIILITMILPAVRKKKEQAYEEGGG